MAKNSGSNLILSVEDTSTAGTYNQAAFMKDITMDFAAGLADVTNQQSSGVREMLAGTGIKGFDVSFSAIYDVADAQGMILLRTNHLARSLVNIQISDGIETITCAVEVVSVGISAASDGTDAIQASVTLKSSGAVTVATI